MAGGDISFQPLGERATAEGLIVSQRSVASEANRAGGELALIRAILVSCGVHGPAITVDPTATL